jgi:hypothetical protein
MQKTIVICFALVLCALIGIAATIPTSSLRRPDLRVNNTTDSVGVTIQKGSQTANFLEAYEGSTLKAAIPAAGIVNYGASEAVGRVVAGTATTSDDGTVTNTFVTAFSVAPIVTATLVNHTGPTNTVTAITTSNFVYNAGSQSKVVNWIAVGAP